MFKIIIFLIFVLNSTLSYSHSQLTEILPKDNVIYTKTPPQIKLKFRSKVKLVKVNLNKVAEDNQKIKLNLDSFKKKIKRICHSYAKHHFREIQHLVESIEPRWSYH